MSRAVLISIRPKWCEKIVDGTKTIEVRRTRPKLETPFKVYIYCTKAEERLIAILKDGDENYGEIYHGKPVFIKTNKPDNLYAYGHSCAVIGEFICDKIYEVAPRWKEYIVLGENKGTTNEIARASCLSFDDMKAYLGEANGYGWHISELEIYDHPKKLEDFMAVCRYKNDDGTCPSRKIACSFQRYDYNHDGSVNLVECGNSVRRPPQSWQYVEELK